MPLSNPGGPEEGITTWRHTGADAPLCDQNEGNEMFIIEDEIHAELCGEFESFSEAFTELQARSRIPWDQKPNVCPCTSWKTCEREYSIVEYYSSSEPWREISRTPVLTISAKGTIWNKTLPV